MRILKNVVKDKIESQNHGLMFSLIPSRKELRNFYYDYEFEIGDLIEYENETYKIIDKDLSTPDVVTGCQTWYVKVIKNV